MATDYDTPRKNDTDEDTDSLELLQASATTAKKHTHIDIDETEAAETMELPGADLSNERLEVTVIPQQQDEFTCTQCFLVYKTTLLATSNPPTCRDCAT